MSGIQRIDRYWYKSSHLIVHDDGPFKPGKKTRKFNVFNTKHSLLGNILWHGPWKQYCYFPLDSTMYDKGYLRQVADFCEFLTKLHKDALPKKRWMRRRIEEKRKRRIEQIKEKKLLTNSENYETIISEVEET